MKALMENWRGFLITEERMTERINHLRSGKRFIVDRLVEVTEAHNNIEIPNDELARIKSWANLSGEANFLGRGSMGSAFKFDDKVLKITSDPNEAHGAVSIVGKQHPNVYTIHAVGQRSKESMENSGNLLKKAPYVIVYEYLDYPNTLMTEVSEKLYHKVRKGNTYYNWESTNLTDAKQLMIDFVEALQKDKTLLGEPPGKYKSIEPKLKEIADKFDWDEKQYNVFQEFWTLVGGMYGEKYQTVEGIAEYTASILNDARLKYFHQLCLGLTFLNDHGVKFNDLKKANIMEKNGQAAIIDIGYSQVQGAEAPPPIEGPT